MTEADTPGAAALDVSEEVSSCEAAVRLWAPACAGARPPANAGDGFCPCARRRYGVPGKPGTPVIKRKRRASGGCLGTERR